MKIRSTVCKKATLLFVLFLASIFFLSTTAISAEKAKRDSNKRSKIRVTSNSMVAKPQKRHVDFTGNVKVVFEDFILKSDILRIYYAESSANKNNPIQKGSISKIVASGNVHITSEKFVADSDLALYLTKSMVFVLKGPNSKITSGENSIVGSKITYYRSDGRVKIEGSKDKRVVAVFYSRKNEKGDYSILPESDDEEKALPSTPPTSLEEKEIAE